MTGVHAHGLRGSRAATFAVLAIAATTFSLLQSLIVPVLTTLQDKYDTSQATVTWVITGYLLSASICTPVLGRLGDMVGKTRMLAITLGFLSLGSLAAALAPSIGWLIAARVLQGAGGGVLPLSFGIVRDEFAERRTLAISVIASLTSLGLGLGIVLAGPIIDNIGVTGLFWLPMAATLAAALAALLFIPESPIRTPTRLPVLPALFLAGGLVAVLLGLSQGGDWGWRSPAVLGLFVVGAVLLVVWVRVEQRVAVPMIDMQMMRRRGVWTANVVAGAVGFAMYAAYGFVPQLVQTPRSAGYGFDESVTASGRLLLPSAICSFAVGFLTATLIRRLGARRVIVAALVLAGGGLVSIALFHGHLWQLYAATTAQGVGSGLVLSSLASVVVVSVPAEQTGVASGINANIRTIGGSIGSAVMAGIVTADLGAGGYPSERGYEIGFAVLGVVVVLSVFAAMAIPHARPPRGIAETELSRAAELAPRA